MDKFWSVEFSSIKTGRRFFLTGRRNGFPALLEYTRLKTGIRYIGCHPVFMDGAHAFAIRVSVGYKAPKRPALPGCARVLSFFDLEFALQDLHRTTESPLIGDATDTALFKAGAQLHFLYARLRAGEGTEDDQESTAA